MIVDPEIAWIAGLWAADRGSTAKGVVSIANRCEEILENFVRIAVEKLGIDKTRIKARLKTGYSPTPERYFTSTRSRVFIEEIVKHRTELPREAGLAYLAGMFDGDGSVDPCRSILYFGYGIKSQYLNGDKGLIERLGFKTSVIFSKKVMKLRVLMPRYFAQARFRM